MIKTFPFAASAAVALAVMLIPISAQAGSVPGSSGKSGYAARIRQIVPTSSDITNFSSSARLNVAINHPAKK